MAFQWARSARTVLRVVPVLPESGFRDHAPGCSPLAGQAASHRMRYADLIVKIESVTLNYLELSQKF
jgi:hypothetical protein